MGITVSQYQVAISELEQMEVPLYSRETHPAIRRHFKQAVELLLGAKPGERRDIEPQKIRDELLELRTLLGEEYDHLPAPDKLIRHCGKALDAVPGEGEPSQAPYH